MSCPKNSCSCACSQSIRAVTIKGIDKTDGTTVWEYGPGSFWRHHYGADAISGIVPNLSATLNKYAIAAGAYPSYNACDNRNSATILANCAEGLSLVKLNSLDGTTVESATLTGVFTGAGSPTSITPVQGITITNAAALSGGDYVIVGERLPFIEFVDYNTNTVNKEYILHAHGQQNGNVYLKTRTSNETITIPHNSTAAAVETLFEATSDCVAATATGGPWPLLPISIDVEWSVSSGDIASISATDTYTASGVTPTNTYTETFSIFPFTTAQVILSVSAVSIGSDWSFTFDGGGATFTYTSATDNTATFITALEAAMEVFKAAQGTDGFWDSTVITETAGNLHVTYAYAIRHLRVTVDDNADPVEDSRRAGSCAAAYDTGTGAMTSAVGYEFGYSADRPTLRMFSETGSNPTVSGLNVLGIRSIGSGPSDTVVVTPQLRGTGDNIKANVVEKWTISGGAWAFSWQTYCNAEMAMPLIIPCESGYVICPINAKRFDGVRDRTAARIAVSDTTTVELETTYGSITVPDNQVSTQMFDGTPGSYFSYGYDVIYQDPDLPNNRFRFNVRGADTWVSGNEFRFGAVAFGCDGTSVFGTSYGAAGAVWNYDGVGSSASSEPWIRYYVKPVLRSAEPQQFRFKVTKMPGTNYTTWLDWYATETEIEDALNALLGTGNCSIVDLGSGLGVPIGIDNSPVSIMECNPAIAYKVDTGFSPGSGRIPAEYLTFRNDGVFTPSNDIIVEIQSTTAAADPAGISAYDASDATVTWSRVWGTKGAQTISQHLYAWLEGDFVYAYGNLVDNELP
jgi:hypothetical protein